MKRNIPIIVVVLAALAAAKLQHPPKMAKDSGDHVVTVSDGNAEMNEAIAQAKLNLPIFFAKVLDASGKMSIASSIKVAMPTAGGPSDLEHIWVMPFRKLADGSFSGELNDDPRYLGDIGFGDTIRFNQDQVSDWTLVMPDGLLYGSYTTRVLLSPRDGIPNGPKFSKDPLPANWVN